MSETSAVSSATAASTAVTSGTSKVMGQDDFLKLLIAQLKYQDPMSPMEDKDFIAQLAQFSTLQQTISMSNNIDDMSKSQTASQAFAMTGKWIDYIGSDGNTAAGRVDGVALNDGVATLKVGSNTVELGSELHVYPGVDSLGEAATAKQSLQMIGQTVDFVDKSTGTTISGRVDSVNLADGWPKLNIGSYSVEMGDVLRVQGGSSSSGTNDLAALARAMVGKRVDYTLSGTTLSGLVTGVTSDGNGRKLKIGADVVDVANVIKVYPAK